MADQLEELAEIWTMLDNMLEEEDEGTELRQHLELARDHVDECSLLIKEKLDG